MISSAIVQVECDLCSTTTGFYETSYKSDSEAIPAATTDNKDQSRQLSWVDTMLPLITSDHMTGMTQLKYGNEL